MCTPIGNGTGLLSCQDNTTTKTVPNDTTNPFKCLSGFALTLGSGPSQSDSCTRMWLATGARRHTRMRLDMHARDQTKVQDGTLTLTLTLSLESKEIPSKIY